MTPESDPHNGNWPHFFIVGAPKAGTTSLFRYLRQQPGLFLPALKEPHFFSGRLAADLQMEHISSEAAYLDLFATAGANQLCGEASTSYLRDPKAPQRLKDQIADAKIIMLLRDPLERAFSHYLMRWRAGGFSIPFAEGLANYHREEPEYQLFRALVLEPGFYGAQLARYLRVFDAEQIKVIIAEQFSEAPEITVSAVLDFLGVENAGTISDLPRHNDYVAPRGKLMMSLLRQKRHLRFLKPLIPAQLKWRIVRTVFNKRAEKPTLSPQQRELLKEIYAQDTRELRQLLGQPDLWTDTVGR